MKTITSSVAFQDESGAVLANGSLILTLPAGIYHITSGGGQVAGQSLIINLDNTAKISGTVQIWASDELTPQVTYNVTLCAQANGAQPVGTATWLISGTSPIDLSGMTQTSSGISFPGIVLLNPTAQQTINGQVLDLEGAPLAFSAAGSTVADAGFSRTAAGAIAVGNGTQGNKSGTLNAAVYQVGTSSDAGISRIGASSIAIGNGTQGDATGTAVLTTIKQGPSALIVSDALGISHLFISSTAPYSNTFLAGNGTGNVFLGSAAKTNVADGTGAITTAGILTLQKSDQTLGANITNDALGGISFISNAGSSMEWINSGVLLVNPSALGSGAALTVGGTSPTTGGMSIFVGATGGQNEIAGLYPADGSSAKLRVRGLSIRNLNSGFLTGTEVAGITSAGVASGLRITPRVVLLSSSTTFTPDGDNSDMTQMQMTGVAGTLTIAAPSGTPVNGQKLLIKIIATNAQTYSFNATYHFSASVTAPTTISAGKTDYIGFIWNSTNTAWDVVAVDQGH